ncbi:hypothetical protein OIE62_27720 [Streptomyces scopuliridis]|uniref:Uncharacterized protein n=1 Tax=Streptomyces scopuliridis TaxID=452529 RepID=A0ACD4ZHN6_9ACTN|nr:hypothetical protein [Streptomyces scopuliridis]WSB97883.1 hypothetical protein OG835_13220 [Streptomyces scopuliridis]WSC08414.1 hypothetical protein OIE62_27720 [Streptomyces scopuliridis]
MSRETDSSSSGPQGRGGAAYPSGTPPYGSRQYPSLHPQQDAPEETETAPAPQPDEPRTETTLTTRIRINIPGSRPIPPVVMRTPMGDADSTDGRGVPVTERTGGLLGPDASQDTADAGEAEAAEEPQAEDRSTSDWFAPRRPATSGTGTAAGMSAGLGAGAAAVAGTTAPRPADHGSSESPYYPGGGQSQNGGAPRSALSDLASGAGSQSSGPQGIGAQGPGSNGFAPGGSGTDFTSGGPTTPALGIRPPGGGPSGPTSGPVTGGASLGTPPSSLSTPPGAGQVGPPRMSDDTAVLTPQQPAAEPGPGGHVSGDTLTSGIPVVPAEHRSPFPGSGPQGGPHSGPGPRPDGPGGHGPGAPGPGAHGPGALGQDHDFSVPDFPGPVGSSQGAPPSGTAPAPARTATPAAPAAKKKGRSKLTLLGVLVVVAAGGVYGAGLLMNHSDVPKGTTVLGVDIGGGTRDEAVNKLDAALGERAAAPLRLSIGGKTEELTPDKAGLSLDSQATVRAAAGSDYNPVSVIGSLFGGARVAQPVILVDDEKLTAALTDLAGVSGSASEGTIKFEPGKAVALPGKAGKALDVNHSIISTRDAYRAQVQTGKINNVELPVVTREPTVGQAELDRAMNEFAKPAMSDLITIKAGGKQIQFGPAKSLPKILSMKAVDGKLVEVYNRTAIDQLLEGVFDGITITKGDGKQYPVSSADVAQAMQTALRGKTPAERTQTINLNPS